MSKDRFAAVEKMETLTNMLSAEVSRQVREQLEGKRRSKPELILRSMTPLQRRIVFVLDQSTYEEEGTRAELARSTGVKPQAILKAVRGLLANGVVAETKHVYDTKRKYLRLPLLGQQVADAYKELRAVALETLFGNEDRLLERAHALHLTALIRQAQAHIRGVDLKTK